MGRRPVRGRVGRRGRIRRRRALTLLLAVAAVALLAAGVIDHVEASGLTPLRARIVSTARSQLGYRTDPASTYCNKFSAHWGTGTPTGCAPGLRAEEWCADFAAWAWQQAGARVSFGFAAGQLGPGSFSFYTWGVDHGTWHPVGSRYVPRPGDVALYGLNVPTQTATHVAVVTSFSLGARGPDVVNGDGDRTGFSVVETGTDQYRADVHTAGGLLSGYVAPSPSTPPPASG